MVVVVVVQEAYIQSEASLEHSGVLLKIILRGLIAHHICEEVLQLSRFLVENPRQCRCLQNVFIPGLALLPEMTCLTKTVWKQVVRSYAELASSEWNLSVCIGRLPMLIRSSAI